MFMAPLIKALTYLEPFQEPHVLVWVGCSILLSLPEWFGFAEVKNAGIREIPTVLYDASDLRAFLDGTFVCS